MSFFDKLKKNIGIDIPEEETKDDIFAEKTAYSEFDQNAKKATQKKEKKEEEKKQGTQPEGELAIDIYETNEDFVIHSTIAGVKAEELDISVENDLVIIRGARQNPVEDATKKYFYQECYWGSFSRQIILPEEVDGSKAEAKMKDGVLTLKMPKIQRKKKRKIIVEQENS